MKKGNIIFIGGIHGVGKGHICNELSKIFSLENLTASQVLKWSEKGKQVKNVEGNQNILIQNLRKIISINKNYLLDGHFSLLKEDNSIENISLETFREINPILIILITEDVEIIQQRLKERDNIEYPLELLSQFQENEISQAKKISHNLEIEYVQILSTGFETIIPIINKLINN